jgi:hypothetical protein
VRGDINDGFVAQGFIPVFHRATIERCRQLSSRTINIKRARISIVRRTRGERFPLASEESRDKSIARNSATANSGMQK